MPGMTYQLPAAPCASLKQDLRWLILCIGVFALTCACARREDRLLKGHAQRAETRPAAMQGDDHIHGKPPPPDSQRQFMFEERKAERERLVSRSIAAEGIDDARVLAAMRRVPRHRFMPVAVRDEAYENRPVPIGFGQTISQPYIVALMSYEARIQPSDRCLEVGTGSGYQAAVLAELCKETYSIEYLPQVAEFGKSNLSSLGYRVELRTGDGYRGWPEAAPFDVILVTAAPERVPAPLLEQLAINGRLVIPVGGTSGVQQLERWIRKAPGNEPNAFQRSELASVRFVPLLGEGAQ
jgi:protein-L-isoaspartate(D-aspartate) O-methyltransferase